MIFEEIENVKRPIVYISLSLIMGSLCYGIYSTCLWLAVLSAGLFFIYVICETNIYFGVIVVLFFIVQISLNYNYYNLEIEDNIKGEVKITERKDYYTIGDYKGRKLYLEEVDLQIKQGDEIYFEGKFIKEFNKEKGIIGRIKVNKCTKLPGGFISYLYKIRSDIYYKLEENLGSRKAGLISSLAFGNRKNLDIEDEDEMRNLGIIHAISVSGMHVALVFIIMNKLMGKTIALSVTILYVLLTGAAFSAIRALIMIIFLVLSHRVKKNNNRIATLAISAGIIIVIKPYCIFNIGFVLSYMATVGIILFNYRINNKLYKLPKYLRETISIGVSAQILTLPIIISIFKEVSITSILGNLIIIPILNILIVLGNFLLPCLLVPDIFDFICFIILQVINWLDYIMESLYTISSKTFIANEAMVIIYCFTIISVLFIIKGYKKFIALPIITIIVMMIYIYSPVARIDYLKEGGILISLRGDRKIITNKINVDMARLKKTTIANSGYKLETEVNFDNIKITGAGKNFILNIKSKEYFLRMNNSKEKIENYDIIDFIDSDTKGFFIIGDKLLEY